MSRTQIYDAKTSLSTSQEIVLTTNAEIDEEAVVPFEPYILIEGILEKAKERKKRELFGLSFGPKKKWVKRYFILRCKDPQTFFLEQLTDDNPKSKVHWALEMNWVSQVCNNLKNRNKNWIFSIHFSTGQDERSNVAEIYLAASSEEQMNRWVSELCKAGELQKQGCDETSGIRSSTSPIPAIELPASKQNPSKLLSTCVAKSMDSFFETSVSESVSVMEENMSANTTGYTLLKNCSSGGDSAIKIFPNRNLNSEESAPITPYIHLKNCASKPSQTLSSVHRRNQSVGSSSASSDQFSYSSDMDNINVETSLKSRIDALPPPPRPPKTKIRLCSASNSEREGAIDASLNALNLSANAVETSVEDNACGDITIRPLCCGKKANECITLPQVVLPLQDNLIPPKVDRSCKPHRKEKLKSDVLLPPPRRHKNSLPTTSVTTPIFTKPKHSVPVIPRTSPLSRIQHETVKNGDNSSSDSICAQDIRHERTTEYLDPAQNYSDTCLDVSESSTASNAVDYGKNSNLVEYVLVDEASTQAVIHANILQNELRAKKSQW